jgi:hypothetical protein
MRGNNLLTAIGNATPESQVNALGYQGLSLYASSVINCLPHTNFARNVSVKYVARIHNSARVPTRETGARWE